MRPLAGLAFLADNMPNPLELPRHVLIRGDDVVKGIGYLAFQSDPVAGESHREIARAHRLKSVEERANLGLGLRVVSVLPRLTILRDVANWFSDRCAACLRRRTLLPSARCPRHDVTP